jgi:lysozyme family protein
MKALTPEMVAPLYENRYWDACKCDDLASGVDYVVFDTAVNSGKVRAIKFLQSVVGAVPDGAIGPVTIASANGMDSKLVIEQFCDKREAFWKSLSTFDTFGKGWLRRGNEVKTKALEMV